MYDTFLESLRHLPLMARFAVALLVVLTIPPLCQRVRLPAVGLLLAGPQHGELAHA